MKQHSQSSPNPQRPHRAFFGRVSGKRLHNAQHHLLKTLLPELEFDLPTVGFLNVEEKFPSIQNFRVLEIGYGGGEHLMRIAKQNPAHAFIGCEVFTGGIGKILQKISEQDPGNISLFSKDAYQLLLALPDASLDGAYLLYPDPWPKTRHNKRRFVSKTTLEELGRVLKPGGFFAFATDIEDYANWTLAHILAHKNFVWPLRENTNWHTPFAGWQPTRYEEKARQEGRSVSFYFTFFRAP